MCVRVQQVAPHKVIREMIPALVKPCLHLSGSKEGSEAAVIIAGLATAKHRKGIVKIFKERIEQLVCNPWGYRLAMKLVDCVDDTVLMRKAFWNEITQGTSFLGFLRIAHCIC